VPWHHRELCGNGKKKGYADVAESRRNRDLSDAQIVWIKISWDPVNGGRNTQGFMLRRKGDVWPGNGDGSTGSGIRNAGKSYGQWIIPAGKSSGSALVARIPRNREWLYAPDAGKNGDAISGNMKNRKPASVRIGKRSFCTRKKSGMMFYGIMEESVSDADWKIWIFCYYTTPMGMDFNIDKKQKRLADSVFTAGCKRMDTRKVYRFFAGIATSWRTGS
jgi:hypothetical protein